MHLIGIPSGSFVCIKCVRVIGRRVSPIWRRCSRESPPPLIDLSTNPVGLRRKGRGARTLETSKPTGYRRYALPVHFNLDVWPPPVKLRQEHHCRPSYTGGCSLLLCLPVLIPVVSSRMSPRASATPSPEDPQGVRGSSFRPAIFSTAARKPRGQHRPCANHELCLVTGT